MDIVDFQLVMAVTIREYECEWIENHLKLWEKLQKNMERFSYYGWTLVDNPEFFVQGFHRRNYRGLVDHVTLYWIPSSFFMCFFQTIHK
jgi:hypothetical protein